LNARKNSGVALQIMVEQESQRMARTVNQIVQSVAEVEGKIQELKEIF
jgi:hypothetical protein